LKGGFNGTLRTPSRFATEKKKEGFSLKKCSDRAQVHLFAVSMCQNQVISGNCCGMPLSTETALAISLLQILVSLLPIL